MQSVEIKGLDKVITTLDSLPEAIRKARIEALEAEAEPLLTMVQQGIGRGPRRAGDNHLHVADVQGTFMGSGGGYIAIRAMAKTDIVSPGGYSYAAGYVTNSLENGHVGKSKMGQKRRYLILPPKAATYGRVEGKHMYHKAQPAAEQASRRVKEKIEKAVKEHMG